MSSQSKSIISNFILFSDADAAEEMRINMNTNMEDIMQYFKLFIITSADKYSKEEWKDMEADIMQTLKTTEEYGGIKIISEKTYKQKLYKCNQCDFRANLKCTISHHKRREHTCYMLLCDQCGYTTNDSGHFKRHVKAKHAKYLL